MPPGRRAARGKSVIIARGIFFRFQGFWRYGGQDFEGILGISAFFRWILASRGENDISFENHPKKPVPENLNLRSGGASTPPLKLRTGFPTFCPLHEYWRVTRFFDF